MACMVINMIKDMKEVQCTQAKKMRNHQLNPTHALHGGVSYFVFVCVCVFVNKISQKY